MINPNTEFICADCHKTVDLNEQWAQAPDGLWICAECAAKYPPEK